MLNVTGLWNEVPPYLSPFILTAAFLQCRTLQHGICSVICQMWHFLNYTQINVTSGWRVTESLFGFLLKKKNDVWDLCWCFGDCLQGISHFLITDVVFGCTLFVLHGILNYFNVFSSSSCLILYVVTIISEVSDTMSTWSKLCRECDVLEWGYGKFLGDWILWY